MPNLICILHPPVFWWYTLPACVRLCVHLCTSACSWFQVVRIMRLLKVASLAQPQHSLLAAAVKQEGEVGAPSLRQKHCRYSACNCSALDVRNSCYVDVVLSTKKPIY